MSADTGLLSDLHPLMDERFHILEVLSQTPNSTVYRGIRREDNRPIIIKRLISGLQALDRQARYHQEFQLASSHSRRAIVRALELVEESDLLLICIEDMGGYSLSTLRKTYPLHELSIFFPLAMEIARALDQLHQLQIIHKDINPANIVFNVKSGEVELIDLGISSRLSHETPQLLPPSVLEGTLPYLSPEQSGRMNRRVDQRSDFYSLGVTFFELLTRRLPYEHQDPLELVHAHMAGAIPQASAFRPDIPTMLDALLTRLMAKQAEDRYQSAQGLLFDLDRCWQHWRDSGSIPSFPLGERDRSPILQLRERLYGREHQEQLLMQAFDRARVGRSELLLVSGYSGIGKSALVHELHRPITARRGLFCSGKFDQYARGIAYSAISQALRGLIQQLLAEPESPLRALREALKEALGNGAGVAAELIPELALLLESIPPVDPLTGLDAQNRFNQTMRRLLTVLAQPERPLVIFIDDLQWADVGSLSLMENLLLDDTQQHVLWIGAYRDQEVQPDHPLHRTRAALDRGGVRVTAVHLLPLEVAHLKQLLGDALSMPEETVSPLAELVLKHTLGNPFFVGQFIREIYQRSLLSYDFGDSCWRWDLDQIVAQGFTDNVIDLLVHTLRLLPESTQRVLEVAACIGNQFSLELLSWVLQEKPASIVTALWPAFEQGFLDNAVGSSLPTRIQVGGTNQVAQVARCRFVHDRIQQSAYTLLKEDAQAALHLRIGRQLLSRSTPEQREAQLFATVAQLNRGRALLTSLEERLELARLNLEAARKAQRSTAYESAAQALQVGRELLFQDPWEVDHLLNFSLHLSAAECAYLLGRFAEADDLYSILKGRARARQESLEIGMVQADHYLLQARHLEGLAVARECFQRIGVEVPLPVPELEAALTKEIHRVEETLGDRPVEALLQLPETVDPLHVAALRLSYGMFLNAFLSGQGTLAFFSLALGTRISLENGNCALSGYLYVGYGMVLYLLRKQYAKSFHFGDAGVKVAERFPDLATRCKTNFLFAADLHSWTQPLRAGQAYYDRAYQLALESGDGVTLGYVVAQSASDRMTSGVPLQELLPIFLEQRLLLKRVKNEDGENLLRVASLQPILALQGQTDGPQSLDTDEFCEGRYLEKHAENSFYQAWLSAGRIRIAWLLGDETRFEYWLEKVKQVEQFIPSHAKVPECCFFGALMCLELLAQDETPEERLRHSAELERLITRLEEFAQACPANVEHRLNLILGEKSRVEGRFGDALEHFEKGIRLAREGQFLPVEAIGLELYARLYHSLKRSQLETSLLREARSRYARWGATAVVKRLELAYPSAFVRPVVTSTSDKAIATTLDPLSGTSVSITATKGAGVQLDLATVVRASQALSTQNDFEEASRNLLQIVRLNSGAQRAVLILKLPEASEGTLDAVADEQGLRSMGSLGLDGEQASDLVCSAIIRYVLRTQRAVVLASACTSGDFVHDGYIQKQQVRSISSLPLQSQGQVHGAVYLENNYSAGVFTPERVETLHHLAVQLAVTVTNARLYRDLEVHKNHLEQLVQERTRVLNDTLIRLKATQKELVRSARLAGLGNTVAGVAHELNTPLGVALTGQSLIMEELEFLQESLHSEGTVSSEQEETFERILEASQLTHKNLQRAAQLVKTFKLVAVDSSRSEKRSLQVLSYFEEVLFSLSPLIKRHQLAPRFAPESQNPTYFCDPGLLAQVLTNLLENCGVHAYRGKGGAVEIGITQDEHGLQIWVKDFGAGMTEEVMASAFDPFFTTHREHGGTGLGLHVVHNVVHEGLGGELSLSSRPGEGSTITLLLPPSPSLAR